MKRRSLIGVSAVALAVAGLLWSFKAGSIMVTGYQSVLATRALQMGQLLFPIGIIGIYLTLDKPGTFEKTSLMLAVLSLTGTLLGLLYSLLPGAQISTGEEFLFPQSLFVLIGSTGGFAALLLLGITILRSGKQWNRWQTVPVIVALIPLPLIATGLIHFEMPIFLIGVAWLLLAYGLWRVTNTRAFSEDNQSFAA